MQNSSNKKQKSYFSGALSTRQLAGRYKAKARMNNALNLLWVLLLVGCFSQVNEISSYGIVDNPIIVTEPNSDLLSGEKHIIGSWNLVKKTEKIPNIIGIEFGIAYKLNEFSEEDVVYIEEIIIFPNEGLTNPSTGVSKIIDSEIVAVFPEEEQYFSYSLDYPWEAKSGTWIFQVKKDNEILLEKKSGEVIF